jgi:hypothetical protein
LFLAEKSIASLLMMEQGRDEYDVRSDVGRDLGSCREGDGHSLVTYKTRQQAEEALNLWARKEKIGGRHILFRTSRDVAMVFDAVVVHIPKSPTPGDTH